MKTAFLMLATLALSPLLCAQEIKVPKAYEATTKSSFTAPPKGRNPFWPIGFWPVSKTVVSSEQLLRIPVEQFKVTSIFLGDPSFAVINGKDYTTGQFLTVNTATGLVKILIARIEDGVVFLQYKTMVAKVPISRK